MNIGVRYLAQLRHIAGRTDERITLSAPATVTDLVRYLAARDERLGRILLDGGGRIQPTILIFIGDEQAGREQALSDGDEVTLMTPIAGGAVMLSDEERAVYEWQLGVPDFGEAGQERLKAGSVLISRVGGVGGLVAYQLAAAGVGRLVLAHAGELRLDDLNRQLLMSQDGVGQSRVELAARRLKEFNPRVVVETVNENISESNAGRLMSGVDVAVGCAPLFSERLALNRAAVRLGIPLVDCSMYELQVQVMTVLPGQSACLACLYPEAPPQWQRRFPVFGAVSGVAGCLGAMEVIKVVAGLGDPLAGRMLLGDLREMVFRKVKIERRADCEVCGTK